MHAPRAGERADAAGQVRPSDCLKTLLEPMPLVWLYHALRDHESAHYAVKIAAAAAGAAEAAAGD